MSIDTWCYNRAIASANMRAQLADVLGHQAKEMVEKRIFALQKQPLAKSDKL